MKNKMLSAVDDAALKIELERLFGEYPFAAMAENYARKTGFIGVTFDDCSIYILDRADASALLATYLHEVAHASQVKADGSLEHGDIFIRICRELEERFGVGAYANHAYDQQDATYKKSYESSKAAARLAASQATYDPTHRAAQLTYTAYESEQRGVWQGLIIIAIIAIIAIAASALPWATWYADAGEGTLQLAGGAAMVSFLCWFTRG